ncbi:MAG: 2,3-diphosphoglycerate synthetase [Actinomycetota bacterium]|nr:2,3-diphosphoglycerate synthetase [Actinomycetota bacterium]
MGPDFLFEYIPKPFSISKPSISIIGTGKRLGKTAISSYISKQMVKNNIDVCVLAMGRGGPAQPQVIKGGDVKITPEFLLDLSQKGLHASSDYLEDALMSSITTVGCRRCGGGFGGKIFLTNIKQGIKEVEQIDPHLAIVEGSGASVPDVKTDATICVMGAYQDWDSIIGYLGLYRIMVSDMVVITMCEPPLADQNKIDFLKQQVALLNPSAKVFTSVFRPQPLQDIKGKQVFVAMTAKHNIEKEIKTYIEKQFSCRVNYISFNLSNRKQLRRDLETAEGYDTILTELKAASVDVLTDFAFSHDKLIVYMNNIPIMNDSIQFEQELLNIYGRIKQINAKKVSTGTQCNSNIGQEKRPAFFQGHTGFFHSGSWPALCYFSPDCFRYPGIFYRQ